MPDNKFDFMIQVKEYFEPYFDNIMAGIKDIKDEIKDLKTLEGRIIKLETQLKVIWVISGAIGLGVVGWLIKTLLGLIK